MTNQPNRQLIVDCQLLQSSDRSRGMGFFFRSLLTNVGNRAQPGSWVFLINKRLPDLKPEDKRLLEKFNGSYIYLDLLHKGDHNLFAEAADTNRSNINKTIKPLLNQDRVDTIFFIPGLFSYEIYPVFPTQGTTNALLFYDIIPFLYHQHYFEDHEGSARKDYSQRYREFYKADLLLAISQTTADDLNVYFGVDPSRIVTILGAAADRLDIKPRLPEIASQLGNDFVLMPSGDDYRKNNKLAVKAFDQIAGQTKLVITSDFSPDSKRVLSKLCPQLIFSGSVSDEEYLWLIDHARAVFFPTEYEGLGMPVLEAVERAATIVCSNIPVFAEISQGAFFYCEPGSISSMTAALEEALQAPAKKLAEKKQHYSSILDKFSWAKTASSFVEALYSSRPAEPKQKLAVFGPSPSSYSAVGKYVFEVHAELSRLYDIDYYIESGQTTYTATRPNILEYAANYLPATAFDIRKVNDYDNIIYHIGNSEFHTETILNSLRLSANAIVHDTRLGGIFDYMVRRDIIPPERRAYEARLDKALKAKNTRYLSSIVSNQKVIFCHSLFAKSAIDDILLSTRPKVQQIIHPIGVPAVELARTQDVPTVSFAGIISESKGISLVTRISELGKLNIKVFGFGILGDSPLLNDMAENVEVIKDLSDKAFQDLLRRSDILVNYRARYHGETSRSTLEAMRHGVVVIVRRVGWFDELPDNAVMKADNELEAVEAVRTLLDNPKLRRSISKEARSFLADEHSFGSYAKLIKEGLDSNG